MRRAYMIGLIAVAFAGCGRANQSIQGEVTYGGEPVEDGIIEFIPIEGTKEPSTGAAIVAGRYQIAPAAGPLTGGTYKVAIRATKKTGTTSPDPFNPAKQVENKTNYIPADYNTQTKLKVTISSKASYDFHLEKLEK